jgi:hypothetical protein
MLTVKKAKSQAVNFTSLQGYVDVDYATLCEVFGVEHSDGDGYKTDAEWDLQFSDGVVATIYNYKDGKNYNGPAGCAKQHITDWHVGGKSKLAVRNVERMLEAHFAKALTA